MQFYYRAFSLVVGVELTAYSMGTPGYQLWQSLLGGLLLGAFVMLLEEDK